MPVQRCLWHLGRGVYRAARYTSRVSHELSDDFRRQLEALLLAAYRAGDLAAAQAGYADLIDGAEGCGAWAAANHLRAAERRCSPSSPTPKPDVWSSATRAGPSSAPGCWNGSCER